MRNCAIERYILLPELKLPKVTSQLFIAYRSKNVSLSLRVQPFTTTLELLLDTEIFNRASLPSVQDESPVSLYSASDSRLD